MDIIEIATKSAQQALDLKWVKEELAEVREELETSEIAYRGILSQRDHYFKENQALKAALRALVDFEKSPDMSRWPKLIDAAKEALERL